MPLRPEKARDEMRERDRGIMKAVNGRERKDI